MKTTKKTTKKTMVAVLDMEVKNYIKNIRPQIKKYLESAVLSIIGLEKRCGGDKYEIDHCNGRSSVLIDAFREIALDEAKKIAGTYKPTKDELLSFRESFAREYRNQMDYVMRDLANKKIAKDCKKMFSQIKIDIDKQVKKSILEEPLF